MFVWNLFKLELSGEEFIKLDVATWLSLIQGPFFFFREGFSLKMRSDGIALNTCVNFSHAWRMIGRSGCFVGGGLGPQLLHRVMLLCWLSDGVCFYEFKRQFYGINSQIRDRTFEIVAAVWDELAGEGTHFLWKLSLEPFWPVSNVRRQTCNQRSLRDIKI